MISLRIDSESGKPLGDKSPTLYYGFRTINVKVTHNQNQDIDETFENALAEQLASAGIEEESEMSDVGSALIPSTKEEFSDTPMSDEEAASLRQK